MNTDGSGIIDLDEFAAVLKKKANEVDNETNLM